MITQANRSATLLVGLGLGLGLALACGGCLPEKRVHWSPDGRWAAVSGAEGLYLCDERGELSDQLLAHGRRVTWRRDGRMLCAVSAEKVSTWEAAAERLSEPQRHRAQEDAHTLRKHLLERQGTLEQILPDAVSELTGGEAAAALLILRSNGDSELAARFPDEWPSIREMQIDVFDLTSFEITAQGVRGMRHLLRTFDEPMDPRLAPDGRWIAWITNRPGPKAGATRLVAMPVIPEAEPVEVVDYVAYSCDWTADGQSLVFAATKGWFSEQDEEVRIGVLAQRRLRDDEAAFLETLPEPEDLAGILFHREARVRVLPDNRILFAVRTAQLPAPARDLPPHLGLFILDPQKPGALQAVLPDSSVLGPNFREALSFFEPSPDGRHVAIAAGDQSIGVLTLESGAWWSLQKYATAAGELRSLPSWRSSSELCFVSAPPPGAADRAAVVLARLDFENRTYERRVLSAAWPDAVVRGFLIPDKRPGGGPSTEPALQPPTQPGLNPATQPAPASP